jgi:hypothetical protein
VNHEEAVAFAGVDRCEVLTFDEGLVRTGHGTYPATSG